ncbi:MAG: hypothetical protein MUE85_24645 [Microscillaceae bacterium]|jgi:hypothetical protein|nr:hypothetical protein [Microscillaceae bacterium]
MTVLQLKNNLHQLVDKIEDYSILEAVHTILAKQLGGDLVDWASLSNAEKQAIEQAIQQLDKGEGIAHETVMKKYLTKYQ